MKKVFISLWSVVISLISVVTLISRPTTGGTLWKPNNLTQKEGKEQDQASGCFKKKKKFKLYKSINPPPSLRSTCPGERLRSPHCAFQSRRSRRGLRPSLPVWTVYSGKKHTGMSTDTEGRLGNKANAAVVKRSYFMGLSRAWPWFGKDRSSFSWVPPVFWTGK